MKFTNRVVVGFIPLLLANCSPDALYFSESVKLGFSTEYKPDASEPVNSTFGYKRHVAAVVPPKHQPEPGPDGKLGPMRGEALSLVSKFDVQPAQANSGGLVNISHNFASGRAAKAMVGLDPDAKEATTTKAAPAEVGRRIEALSQPVLTQTERKLVMPRTVSSEEIVDRRDQGARRVVVEGNINDTTEAEFAARRRFANAEATPDFYGGAIAAGIGEAATLADVERELEKPPPYGFQDWRRFALSRSEDGAAQARMERFFNDAAP